jgi:hypothetical protein
MTTTTRFRTALRRVRDVLTAPGVSADYAPWAAVRDYPVARPNPRRR